MPARSVTATEAVPVWAGLATLVATTTWAPATAGGAYRPLLLIVPTAALPPGTPSTAQVAAPAPGTVAVNCCDWPSVSAAFRGVTRNWFGFWTVTVANPLPVPPMPVQLSV